jgi:hypothetical protein
MDRPENPRRRAGSHDLGEPAALPTSDRRDGLWALVREAVGGSHRDFTRESLRRAILLLAVLRVLERIMESVFAPVDRRWRGALRGWQTRSASCGGSLPGVRLGALSPRWA